MVDKLDYYEQVEALQQQVEALNKLYIEKMVIDVVERRPYISKEDLLKAIGPVVGWTKSEVEVEVKEVCAKYCIKQINELIPCTWDSKKDRFIPIQQQEIKDLFENCVTWNDLTEAEQEAQARFGVTVYTLKKSGLKICKV